MSKPRTIREAEKDGTLFQVCIRGDDGISWAGEFCGPWAETPQELIKGLLMRGFPDQPRRCEMEHIIKYQMGAKIVEVLFDFTVLPQDYFQV